MLVRIVNETEIVTGALSAVARQLAQDGNEVEICLSARAYRQHAPVDSLQTLGPEARVTYLRCLGGRTSSLTRLILSLSFSLSLLLHVVRSPKVDTTLLFTQPVFVHFLAPVIRTLSGGRILVVQMDRYPDVLFASGLLRSDGLIGRTLRGLDRWALRRSDHVGAIGRCMSRRMQAAGVPASRIALLPNWSSDLRCAPGNRKSRPQDAKGTLSLLYSGNMGAAHSFKEILASAADLSTDDEIEFVIRGAGRRQDEVTADVARLNLSNVHLGGLLPAEDYVCAINAADVLLITLRPDFAGTVVPSKYYAALSARKPVIFVGPEGSEVALSINESECGVVIPPGDDGALTRAIRTYRDDPELRRRHGYNARQAFEAHYTPAIGVQRYVSLITDLAVMDRGHGPVDRHGRASGGRTSGGRT